MEQKHEMIELIKLVAPGTKFREALDQIVSAKHGALIVVLTDLNYMKLCDGGFKLESDFSPQKIFELSKMDGAIILNSDMTKILSANVQLHPFATIKTNESGTRHRAAERFAIQTGSFVIAVSERKKIITIYQNNWQYKLRDVNDLMGAAGQSLKILERYRLIIEQIITNLTILEFDGLVTLRDVNLCMQKYLFMFKVVKDAKKIVTELGEKGELFLMQLEDIILDQKNSMKFLLLDYYNPKKKLDMDEVIKKSELMSMEDLFEIKNISNIFGYERTSSNLDKEVIAKGFRLLNKILRLNQKDISNIIYYYDNFDEIVSATVSDLEQVKGISKIKAEIITNGLGRLKNSLNLFAK